jgi:hypothetical protein
VAPKNAQAGRPAPLAAVTVLELSDR